VTRHQNLRAPAGLTQSIEQNSRGGRVESGFRLLDGHQRNRPLVAVRRLEQCDQNAESAEGSVRHAGSQEFSRLLIEFQSLLVADRLGVYVLNSDGDLGQVLLDALFNGRRMSFELPEDARDVATITSEQVSGIERLQVPKAVRAEVVEAHAGKSLIQGTELGKA